MKLIDLCGYAELTCPQILENIEVCGVTASSKRVKRGDLFVCIDGRHSSGHEYVDEALEKGAVAVIIQNKK